MDFDNFWTEELQERAIPELTGYELIFNYDDEDHPCYELTDGGTVHVFDNSESIEDVYEYLCKEHGFRERFEEYYADFYKEMQRLNPNGVPRASHEKVHTTYKENL
jgi:hypothetical protein